MTDFILDDDAIARAFRAAEERLATGDPDTLAGRFSPELSQPKITPVSKPTTCSSVTADAREQC